MAFYYPITPRLLPELGFSFGMIHLLGAGTQLGNATALGGNLGLRYYLYGDFFMRIGYSILNVSFNSLSDGSNSVALNGELQFLNQEFNLAIGYGL